MTLRRLPPLNPLLAFEVAARHLSFTKAARELNVTQGAVSRQIAVLEAFFGGTLFERRSNGLALTPNAATYAAELRSAFGEIRAATKAYVAGSASPVLTVKGYTLFLSRWLMPKLPEFNRRHPRINVRLVATSGASHVDFAHDSVDVGIRYGRGRWSGLASHLLFRDALVPVCTPALAETLRLRAPENLVSKVLLQTHARDKDWPDWFAAAGVGAPDALKRVKSFEDLGLVHRCALDGVGIAIVQQAYAQEDLDAGRLVVPCGPVLNRSLGYYLVYPANCSGVPKIAAFRGWLISAQPAPH